MTTPDQIDRDAADKWAHAEDNRDAMIQAFAAHRQAALLEGVRIGLAAAAKMADEWRDENRKNVSKRRHSNMSDMLEGAAIECNALAGEFRKFDPATILARRQERGGA